MRLTTHHIRERVRDHSPVEHAVGRHTRQAAVSVVLRETGDATEALFILRAKREGDPWSGHMAFPGGHIETGDESLRHTAERETLEEIGLDLAAAGEFIGQIDPVKANPRGRNIDMLVTPFVYELKGANAPLAPNYEVADILWGPLDDMLSGESHQQGEFMVQGRKLEYPGYGVGDQIVWGLTYRMLDRFFAILDPQWVSRDEDW